MKGLTISGARKGFGATQVLQGIDLEIAKGEFIVFVGPSGCGKSTLLRTLAGLETLDGGHIAIEGQDVTDLPPAERGIAMVFQSYALYPHMTVRQNMAFGMRMAKAGKAEIEARVARASAMLHLDALLDRLPKQLSGGQRQRVAIGRAITRDPKLFLFDEPLSNLDAALRVATRIEIARLKASMPGTTMVYVTHDQVEAMTLADRIVVLQAGRIEQVGTPLELYRNPANLFVAQFIGSPAMNIVAARGGPVGATHMGIRPEHLALAGDGEFAGTATLVEHLGEQTLAYVDIGAGETLIVKLDGDASVRVGDAVSLSPRERNRHWFDASGKAI
ncbi:ABC transporter ATP-binding protein [Sandaracinobacteroides saxicola]|uniref:ABC transporter ATP-binding protein n=1 Tax=Sandaracinobacteroides saxicola TaxID=2759707 RepID=A0A7G5IM47_9SPHN|nr:ABC transporter ATP-binding protein [Sandaracinobacteroides saxicola]QMW24439.1 ABC transporter ATP-binding protein [Sandaracinobacteroides saxicola]